MKKLNLTPEMCEALWGARAELWIEGFTLCRARVAIKCVQRVYKKMGRPSDLYGFATYVLGSLDDMRRAGHPHLLHWEITAFLKHIVEGGDRATFYAGLSHTRAKRAIHKVMLGGRRG